MTTESDIARLKSRLQDLMAEQQAYLRQLLQHRGFLNSGISEQIVNVAILAEILRYTYGMIESNDLKGHFLNYVE
jgi:hypothetical protein